MKPLYYASLLLLGGLVGGEKEKAGPNVLFILTDQWRSSAFGFAGDQNVKTPWIDRFANESVVFQNAVSVCPVCTPARASLLTGRYPTSTGMFMNDAQLPAEELCLAEIFRARGYQTGYIGKWHLDGQGRLDFTPPERRQGFEYWKALECSHDYNHMPYYEGNDPEMKYWDGYSPAAVCKDAERYLTNHARDKSPFFLFVSIAAPHFPHKTAPDEFKALYPVDQIRLNPNVPDTLKAQAREELQGYYAHCSAIDQAIGSLLQKVQALGLDEETLIVFTSDHGEAMGAQGARITQKQVPWIESAGVPLIIRLPSGKKSKKQIFKMAVTTPDISATLIDLCQFPVPESFEGVSFAKNILNQTDDPGKCALYMTVAPFAAVRKEYKREYRAIKTAEYTYVKGVTGPWLLYQDTRDPYQQTNLVTDPEYSGVLEKMDRLLSGELTRIRDDFRPARSYIEEWGYTVEKAGHIRYTDHDQPLQRPVRTFSQPLPAGQGSVQDIVPPATIERLKAIFERNEYAVKGFKADWMPDGSGYIVLETSPDNADQSLVLYEPATGRKTIQVSTNQLVGAGSEVRVAIESYSFSSDAGKILLTTRTKDQERLISRWVLDRKSGDLTRISSGEESSLSPDGQKILYSQEENLYVYDIQHAQVTQLTHDAVPGAAGYGQASWSPDGSRIVFVHTDESWVRQRSMLVPTDPTFPEVTETRFARVGETIPSLRVGVVDVSGKETRWLSIPAPSEGFYLGQVDWAGNSKEVVVEHLSRFRDQRNVYLVSMETGTITCIFSESDPAWVVASYGTNLGITWLSQFQKFLILSEKDGWRHAYVCSRNGKEQKIITRGEFDIIERVAVDEAGGWFYFLASPANGTQAFLYRVALNGEGKMQRVTPEDQPGYHRYIVSPDSKWAFHTFSSANTPPVTELVQLPEHKVISVLENNGALREKASKLEPVEFFTVDIGNDIRIDGSMIKPKSFDPSRKYPVFIYVYGEPHGQTVRDAWGFAMADYHRVVADLGYIVISMDNRGTPCPKGAAWRRCIAGSLGPLSTEEQAAALKEFGRSRPYADLSRVGIWGWSGGGSNTLNALFRKPDVYHLGIAVVPKPQPQLYNAWFQEIYMKTPAVNPEGYKKSAPLNYAEGLKGNLLIVTGTGETNTHVQIVESLVDRLIELGKQFDYLAYPNRNHGLSEGKGTPVHLRTYMIRYLLTHLKSGPQ